jgi:hypothetical protein
VHPKGKISDIQLKFKSKTELIDNKIRMSVRFGDGETLPSWTEDKTGKRIAIDTKIKNNVYGFKANEKLSKKR